MLFLVWILGSTIFYRFTSECDSVYCIVEQYLVFLCNFQEVHCSILERNFEISVSILILTKSVFVLYFNSAVPEK